MSNYECMTLSIRQAAKILGVSKNVLYAAMRRGEIPFIKVGGRVVIAKALVEKLLADASQLPAKSEAERDPARVLTRRTLREPRDRR